MKHKKLFYLGLSFVVVAVVGVIITVIVMPNTPAYFDPDNIYSIISIVAIIIAATGWLGALGCLMWWAWSKRMERFRKNYY